MNLYIYIYLLHLLFAQILKCIEVDPLFKPRVDGKFLLDSPINLLKDKNFPRMPYMTGTVRAEFGE